MISLYCWNAKEKTTSQLDPAFIKDNWAQIRDSQDVYWIDLEQPTKEEEQLVLVDLFPVHGLTRDDITQRHKPIQERCHLPKVEEFPSYLFVVVNPLKPDFLQRETQLDKSGDETHGKAMTQLSAVLTKTLLITHHHEVSHAADDLRRYLDKHGDQAERGPDYLFHVLLDAMVDDFAPVLDQIQDRLEELHDTVFYRPSAELLQKLLILKRKVFHLRKSLIYEREILARLIRGDFKLIEVREIAYYRNVYDHLVRSTELIETSREQVNDLMQTHLAANSNRMSEVMKVLAMISTVLLPMTLISGIYGMNFEHMPEKDWSWGYPGALSAMALTGIAAVAFFWWKKWL
ncbi:MAG: magnesium/cobalt transporter CorA [Gemmataceae bacterium]